MNSAGDIFADSLSTQKNSGDFFKSGSSSDLRVRAFQAIRVSQMGLAFELFNKYDLTHPNDAWTQAGRGMPDRAVPRSNGFEDRSRGSACPFHVRQQIAQPTKRRPLDDKPTRRSRKHEGLGHLLAR